SVATVESVVGEFYWRVEAGEQARAVDYIAPPLGITKEFAGTAESSEVNYSRARYMEPGEVETAFGITGLPRPSKLGTLQPIAKRGCALAGAWMFLVIAFVAATIAIRVALPHRVLLNNMYYLSQYAGATEPGQTSTAPSTTTAPSTST